MVGPASQTARCRKSAEAKHRSRWICRMHLQMETCDLFLKNNIFIFIIFFKETMFLNTCFTL